MKTNVTDMYNPNTVNATPMMGRGLLSYLLSLGVIGTGQGLIVDKFVKDRVAPDLVNDPVRKNLESRMQAKGIKLLTAKDVAEKIYKNPSLEKEIENMENAFYHSNSNGIYLGKNLKRNGILAHEMGHAEDPKLLTTLNPLGKMVSGGATLVSAFVRPQSAARLAAKIGTLGYGGTLASEISASTRGYKMLGDAGAEKFSDKIQAASGLPTYILSALLPAMTYKGRKFLGAFK